MPAPDPAVPAPAAPPTYGSVWAAPGALSRAQDDYEAVARKVIGPVPTEQALAAIAALRAVLEAAGVRVTEETVADD